MYNILENKIVTSLSVFWQLVIKSIIISKMCWMFKYLVSDWRLIREQRCFIWGN